MQDTYSDFASTTLAANISTSSLTFTVAAGQGALFPAANFVVTIDNEIIFVSSRTVDTFTVLMRGYDGTTAANHLTGAIVVQSLTAYGVNHLWANTADTFSPDVPLSQYVNGGYGGGIQNYGPASTWDNEFESAGTWTTYGSGFDIGSRRRSMLTYKRSDLSLASAYTSFNPPSGQPYYITARISEAIDFTQIGTQAVETNLFVADQSNPTASHDSGNRFRIDILSQLVINNGNVDATRFLRLSRNTNGHWFGVGNTVTVSPAIPLYLRLYCNGNTTQTWTAYFGDGITYSKLASYTQTITPQSMGFQFYPGNLPSGSIPVPQQAVAIDFCRVIIGTSSDSGDTTFLL
jgi:hypothetical protein